MYNVITSGPRNACDASKSKSARQIDRRQSDPYIGLSFAGAIKSFWLLQRNKPRNDSVACETYLSVTTGQTDRQTHTDRETSDKSILLPQTRMSMHFIKIKKLVSNGLSLTTLLWTKRKYTLYKVVVDSINPDVPLYFACDTKMSQQIRDQGSIFVDRWPKNKLGRGH